MPTYDYVCDACEHEWELFQSMGSKAVRSCPECKARKARRLIGAGAGVIFKGSGFYETDYRKDSYRKAEKADRESAKSADSKSTDKKSSKKAEPKSSS